MKIFTASVAAMKCLNILCLMLAILPLASVLSLSFS